MSWSAHQLQLETNAKQADAISMLRTWNCGLLKTQPLLDLCIK